MTHILTLIDQLILMEEFRDNEHKKLMLAQHKGAAAVGESSMMFHLKALRGAVVEKQATMPATITINGKTFDVSVGKTPSWTGTGEPPKCWFGNYAPLNQSPISAVDNCIYPMVVGDKPLDYLDKCFMENCLCGDVPMGRTFMPFNQTVPFNQTTTYAGTQTACTIPPTEEQFEFGFINKL
jgi:hypothetical protein